MKRVLLALAITVTGCGPKATWTPPPAQATPAQTASVATAAPGSTGSPGSTAAAAGSGTAEAPPAPPAPPEAISGALPDNLDAKLVTHAVCKDRDCLVPGLYPSGAAVDGGAPAAVWSHDLPDKASSLTFPRHSGVDLYGVVLSGKVRVKLLEASATGFDLTRWKAFRAPGAGVAVVAVDGPARLLLAVAGDGAPIAETAAQLKDRKGMKKVAWHSRPGSLETADLASSQDLTWMGGAMHARIGFEKGRASFGILFGSKDAGVAQHLHDTSWEILAPLTAAGTAKRASSPGTAVTDMTELEMTDGMVVAMPKGTLHAWQPGGKKPLLAVQMYVPPGPEQRFKKLAADAAATAAGTTPTPTTTTPTTPTPTK